MRIQYAQLASMLVLYSSGLNIDIRDEQLNLTTIAPSASGAPQVPEPSVGESSTSTAERFFKPRPEITATNGFEDDVPTTSILPNVAQSGRMDATQPGIGDILQSFFTATSLMAMPTVHPEQSADGWQDVSQVPDQQSRLHAPHLEASQDGIFQATTAATPQDNRPQVTSPAVKLNPLPAITIGGVTLQPTPITSAQVVIVGDKKMTKPVIDYQYAVGSSLLPIGHSTTINDVVVALNVNPAGSTVLVAGDITSTFPAPAQNLQAAYATTAPQPVQISTAVVDGTTKYFIAGQTLAPGQAVTIGGLSVAFSAKDGTTVLVMGSSTTTLLAATAGVTTTADWGASAVATPGYGGGSKSGPATTSAKKSGARSLHHSNQLLASLAGFLAGVIGIILPLI